MFQCENTHCIASIKKYNYVVRKLVHGKVLLNSYNPVYVGIEVQESIIFIL